MSKPEAVRLRESGFLPLVSVIPPLAQLAPSSRIQPSQLGKTPGIKYDNGTWGGYGWLKHVASEADTAQWARDGANIGILAEYYPGVDIDSLDERISNFVAGIAREVLGEAPARVGRAPKQLLMYRTAVPFARMALVINDGETDHLVEVLGAGRQYLVHGLHPSGSRYSWDTDIAEHGPQGLVQITQADVEAFFDRVTALSEAYGYDVKRVGDGTIRERGNQPQQDLLAPDLEALQQVVEATPNSDDLFPDRESYIKMGCAIKAAAGENEEEGYEVFAEWCGRSDSDRVEGNPETAREDWRRMYGPFSVGWSWLTEQASPDFNAAQFEFDALDAMDAQREEDLGPQQYSDIWIADKVVEEHGVHIRYVPAEGRWYVWDGSAWVKDGEKLAESLVSRTLQRQAVILSRMGATEPEKRNFLAKALKMCSAGTHRAALQFLTSDPRITARTDAFDADIWVLNTPGCMVELKEGSVHPHDPDAMCSRTTSVTPDFDMKTPEWDRFMIEATAGDLDLQLYMQRLAGYALTGSVEEQMLAFIWGPGGNGKGVFLNAVTAILHEYAQTAAMDTFTSSNTDKHPADLAKLVGARLVTASETQSGRRWDEQRLKAMTGGDQITARFMRQDFFTYMPQFTLVFIGNHKPEIRNIDAAMKRRLHLVPFVVEPAEIDTTLSEKLRAEYPGILAWMIQGCVDWQQHGLGKPTVIAEATLDYFEDEDPVGRWIEECCEEGEHTSDLRELYQSWTEWANERGEWVGKTKELSAKLTAKKYSKRKHHKTRRVQFTGLRAVTILPATALEDQL